MSRDLIPPSSRSGRKIGQTRSRLYAEEKTDFHSVCLIGDAEGLVYSEQGQNKPWYPVAVVVASTPEKALRNYNFFYRPLSVFEHCNVETGTHADRLKTGLREVIGATIPKENDSLFSMWTDVYGCFSLDQENEGRRNWWLEILIEAQNRLVETCGEFRVFGNDERDDELMRAIGGF